jgi:hypothetical protein
MHTKVYKMVASARAGPLSGVESFFGKQFPSASSVAVETAPQYLKVLRTGHIRTPPGVSMH